MPDPVRVSLVGLIAGGYSGIPRYAAALARAVDEVSPEFPGLQLELLTTPEGAAATGARSIRVHEIRFHGRRANAGPGSHRARTGLRRHGACRPPALLRHERPRPGALAAVRHDRARPLGDAGAASAQARVQAAAVAVGGTPCEGRCRHLRLRGGGGDPDPRCRPGPAAGDPLRAGPLRGRRHATPRRQRAARRSSSTSASLPRARTCRS